MTTGGEGGMVTTSDEKLWRRMWAFKDHGKDYAAVYEKKHPPGFRWLHESFGTNWRMLEMQAVIGRIQLRRMPAWSSSRREHALTVFDACREFESVYVPDLPADIKHAHYKAYVHIRPERLKVGWSRDRIIDEIVRSGVPCYQGSCSEVYLEKAFDGTDWRPELSLPVARRLGETSLMFLVHPTLLATEMQRTCQAIRDVLVRATA